MSEWPASACAVLSHMAAASAFDTDLEVGTAAGLCDAVGAEGCGQNNTSGHGRQIITTVLTTNALALL